MEQIIKHLIIFYSVCILFSCNTIRPTRLYCVTGEDQNIGFLTYKNKEDSVGYFKVDTCFYYNKDSVFMYYEVYSRYSSITNSYYNPDGTLYRYFDPDGLQRFYKNNQVASVSYNYRKKIELTKSITNSYFPGINNLSFLRNKILNPSAKDTIIEDDSIIVHGGKYDKLRLFGIGEIINEKKEGIWFYFDTDFGILRYIDYYPNGVILYRLEMDENGKINYFLSKEKTEQLTENISLIIDDSKNELLISKDSVFDNNRVNGFYKTYRKNNKLQSIDFYSNGVLINKREYKRKKTIMLLGLDKTRWQYKVSPCEIAELLREWMKLVNENVSIIFEDIHHHGVKDLYVVGVGKIHDNKKVGKWFYVDIDTFKIMLIENYNEHGEFINMYEFTHRGKIVN